MKFDALKQFAKLKQQLTEEKSRIETRLSEINQVLGTETAPVQPSPVFSTSGAPIKTGARPGRKPKGDNSMSLKEAVLKALSNGPLARKDLVGAVENVGYVFNTKNPLNSIGAVLYAKKGPIKKKGGKYHLAGGPEAIVGESNGGGQAPVKKKRKMSAAGRARIAAAQKARRAREKAGK